MKIPSEKWCPFCPGRDEVTIVLLNLVEETLEMVLQFLSFLLVINVAIEQAFEIPSRRIEWSDYST